MASPVASEKPGEQSFDGLRSGADADDSRPAALQGPGALAERVGVRQEAAGSPEHVLAFRGELDTAADPVEHPHSQSRLERVDLPRERRLTEVQA